MKKINSYLQKVVLFLIVVSLASCEKMMEVDTTKTLNAGDHYSTDGEVYGAFFGICRLFCKVADQTVVLAGLRGDLMEPTQKADEEFWKIYRYEADTTNSWATTRPYYDIVINCNDFIRRIKRYNQDNPDNIPMSVYKGLISNVVRYKTWSLFTIAKIDGYVDVYDSNMDATDNSTILTLSLEQAPAYLLAYLQNGEEGVDAFHSLSWKDLLNNQDINWEGCRLEGNVLMAELYLWDGDYQNALKYYLEVVTKDAHPLGAALQAFKYSDMYWVTNPNTIPAEVLTVASFQANNGQQNRLRGLFSNITPATYQIAPTKKIRQLYLAQTLSGEYFTPGDWRGVGISMRLENNKYAIYKYHQQNRMSEDYFVSDAFIHVYRAGEMHLNIAEAYCCLGRFEEAMALLDQGVSKYVSGSVLLPPFTDLKYDVFSKNLGVRGRAGQRKWDRDTLFAGCEVARDSMMVILGKIADENALELSFEGKRWFSMIRLANNMDRLGVTDGRKFLADQICTKFDESEREYYRTLLMDKKNWFTQNTKR